MPTTPLGTVIKVGQVLDLYTAHSPEWGVREVAAALSTSRSSAHALLASLATTGLLRRTVQGRYQLGWRFLNLSHVLTTATRICIEAAPWMDDLTARFGETVHLAALDADRVVYIDKRIGTRSLPLALTGVGHSLPAHCSGVGKVLLAAQPWEAVVRLVKRRGVPAFTENTITSLDQLADELDTVRRNGYATDIEEIEHNLCCIACPINDESGRVVAALSLSVPTHRFETSRETYRRSVLEASRAISDALGYQGAQ